MDKYINADKLFTNLDTLRNPDCEFVTDDYIDGFSDGVSAVMKEVMAMPSADVVEVVKCKDCKYAHYWYGNDDLGNTAYICDMFDTKMYFDDFCSRGEKRNS